MKTTITDTLVGPGGAIVTGSLTVTSAQTFTSADGFVVPQGQMLTMKLPTTGAFTLQLIPNSGATPAGTWYIVSYRTANFNVSETWMVPASTTPVNLLAVRALNPPAPGLVIPFPQNVPDQSCKDILAANPQANPVPIWDGTRWRCGNPSVGSVSMDLELPSVADSGKFQWKPKNSLILTRLSCSVDGGIAAVNLEVRQEGAPNDGGVPVLAAPLSCTTVTGSTTALSNPNVPGLSPVALIVTSAGGGISVVRVHAEYKLSP